MDSYWNHKGKHQGLATALERLIPFEGEVKDHRKNPKLERFRKASNAYYDIFNNGGINRPQAIRSYFGVRMSEFRRWDRRIDFDSIFALTEPAMDKIVLEAAEEQLAKLTAAEEEKAA